MKIPLLAEVDYFVPKIQLNPLTRCFRYRYRNVDDIFLCFVGTNE